MTVAPDMALAARLFERLRQDNADQDGVTRDTYGAGEQRAHDLLAAEARRLGLEVRTDAALNLYLTLPGRERGLPVVMTGSHLDSVPVGGNYDGAAGVVAGLSVLAGWVAAGVQPGRDVTVMAVRAEESAWFPVSYIGSKAAFGKLGPEALEARRFDTGRTLGEHLTELGGQPQALARGEAQLTADTIDCFIELHIEQGPVLLGQGDVLGIVTGICGSLRYRAARAVGRYGHSGATPRLYRQDAVVAFAALVQRSQQDWAEMEAQGHELTLTFGRVETDPHQSDLSKVAGQVDFCIDIRSRSHATLAEMDRRLKRAARNASGVVFDFGPVSGSEPAVMDDALRQALTEAAALQGLAAPALPSGAGHDTATFANAGVASAMLFVRNANGSHNPEETMTMNDFAAGCAVLGAVLARRAGGLA
ncbi:hydantoinase/carbamoylase family amidase [Xylophilus rhododendri]|uniref:Hydantoinase/carbamoylase family amidase n=1 Tax=Xylophilus rhododendri TaxID=2697032 RepID=A0A857J6Y8_9BURK|nr:Zn-dependent hydrolase [Xylophilus rhododendri]QHI99467.1 hydantoinase/carbamoylase family amidase [Xylophilus rhododendri]